MGLMQGFVGNYTEMNQDQLYSEYSNYLMQGEKIVAGFRLIRDVMIITDRRMLDFDKQGATGHKMHVRSIYLNSIFDVTVETAGYGADDSELEVHYIVTPYMKAHSIQCASRKFEFPKKFDVTALYRTLLEYAYDNYMQLNR